MDFFRPESWTEALAIKAAHEQQVVALNGGTDLMVELNFDRRRPDALLDLSRVAGLSDWNELPGSIRLGAGLSMSRIVDELAGLLPALASAARTVGSPQIRNRATIGGNVATGSPAGDALPPLFANDATVEIDSVRGRRSLKIRSFLLGPKRTALADDELIRAIRVPVADGPQEFAKVGTRNAMVIAVCSFALILRPKQLSVGGCIGSAGPTPIMATDATDYLVAELHQHALWRSRKPLDEIVIGRFGQLAAGQASPIDDLRGTASYRRHAVGVLARRTLARAWEEYRRAAA